MDSKKITLITGGIRSGKSRFALSLGQKKAGPKVFIATAQAFDEAMTIRINTHKEERSNEFMTVEEPLYLARAIQAIPQNSEIVLIDCLTLWVNNLLYYFKDDDRKLHREFDVFLEVLANHPGQFIIVTNEIGLGVMSENALARKFADELGWLNQRVAELSDDVIMMIAGLPQFIKGVQSHESMDYSFTKYPSAQ